MVSQLPIEIWALIVEYLPAHQVRDLYSVNKVLFHVAMDLRYKNASIGILPDRVVEETEPPILRNRLLSSRPTALEITFYNTSEHSGPSLTHTKFLSSLKPLFRTMPDKIMGRKRKPVSPKVKLAQLVEQVMRQLPRVEELSFLYERGSSDDSEGTRHADAPIIFRGLLEIMGNRLRSLHIESAFVEYLPSRIESLESFTVDALEPHHTWWIHTIMLKNVPTFLLAHQSAIRKLSLSIDNHTFDITPILDCLQDMTCLHDLDLSLPYGTIPPGDMFPFKYGREILEIHQEHLRSLALRFVLDRMTGWMEFTGPVFFEQDWTSVRFPNVENLVICIPGAPLSQDVETFIRRFSSALVSLEIMHKPFVALDGDKLRNFCTILSDFHSLQHLSLYISDFDIEDLLLISRILPHLRSLFVDYSFYQPHTFNIRTNRKQSLFFHWSLESFNYRTRNPEDLDWIDEQVAFHIPNILWVRGRRRNECLRNGSDTGIDWARALG